MLPTETIGGAPKFLTGDAHRKRQALKLLKLANPVRLLRFFALRLVCARGSCQHYESTTSVSSCAGRCSLSFLTVPVVQEIAQLPARSFVPAQ